MILKLRDEARRAVAPAIKESNDGHLDNLTKVDTTMDGKRGVLLQGFNIIGLHGLGDS